MEWSLVLVAMFAALPPTVTAVLAFLAARSAGREVVRLEHGINSRMDELVETTRAEASATGRAAGVQEERERG